MRQVMTTMVLGLCAVLSASEREAVGWRLDGSGFFGSQSVPTHWCGARPCL